MLVESLVCSTHTSHKLCNILHGSLASLFGFGFALHANEPTHTSIFTYWLSQVPIDYLVAINLLSLRRLGVKFLLDL